VGFVIEKDGCVSNVLVHETSGSAEFAKASQIAVKKSKYKPASEDAKSIQQCINSVQLDFKIGKNKGEKDVRRKLLSSYNVIT
jgi:outer membrane biosynthesis protein TonB